MIAHYWHYGYLEVVRFPSYYALNSSVVAKGQGWV